MAKAVAVMKSHPQVPPSLREKVDSLICLQPSPNPNPNPTLGEKVDSLIPLGPLSEVSAEDCKALKAIRRQILQAFVANPAFNNRNASQVLNVFEREQEEQEAYFAKVQCDEHVTDAKLPEIEVSDEVDESDGDGEEELEDDL